MDKKATLSELGEFGLIDRIREMFSAPEGVTGIGDDCAILPQRSGLDTLVSTDLLIEGTHFLREDIQPCQLGWKSAAVNLSDIAAMGGQPTATFLSLALPADLSPDWVGEFLRGYGDVSGRFGAALLGGDTTLSPDRICINVAVLGTCGSGHALKRSGASPGDLVCVTGTLGDSAAGLKAILAGLARDADVQALIDRHYLPLPRVAEGLRLAATPGVHAMMDISDGIGSDLKHILVSSAAGRAAAAGAEKKHSLRSEMLLQQHPSGQPEPEPQALAAEINLSAIPLSEELRRVCAREGWDPMELAVSGGEDYELLFTVDPAAEAQLPVPHTVIGTITKRFPVKPGMTDNVSSADPSPSSADLIGGSPITWLGSDRPFAGFDHFKK